MSKVKAQPTPQINPPSQPAGSDRIFSGHKQVPMTPLEPASFDPIKAVRRQRDS